MKTVMILIALIALPGLAEAKTKVTKCTSYTTIGGTTHTKCSTK